MSKSMPSRGRLPAVEHATAATPKRSVEQFRLHLLERSRSGRTVIDRAAIRAGMTPMLGRCHRKNAGSGLTAASEASRATSARRSTARDSAIAEHGGERSAVLLYPEAVAPMAG